MRIFIADGQSKIRNALRLLLLEEPQIHIVGEAGNRLALLKGVKATEPDLVLLQWNLSGEPLNLLIDRLLDDVPELTVVVLGNLKLEAGEALAAGADAFISKSEPPDQILNVIKSLLPNQREASDPSS